jgi:hypothetical protein
VARASCLSAPRSDACGWGAARADGIEGKGFYVVGVSVGRGRRLGVGSIVDVWRRGSREGAAPPRCACARGHAAARVGRKNARIAGIYRPTRRGRGRRARGARRRRSGGDLSVQRDRPAPAAHVRPLAQGPRRGIARLGGPGEASPKARAGRIGAGWRPQNVPRTARRAPEQSTGRRTPEQPTPRGGARRSSRRAGRRAPEQATTAGRGASEQPTRGTGARRSSRKGGGARGDEADAASAASAARQNADARTSSLLRCPPARRPPQGLSGTPITPQPPPTAGIAVPPARRLAAKP